MMQPKNLLLAGIPLLLTSSILAAVTPHKPATAQVAGTKKTVAQPSAAQRDNFEQAIRPLLAEHCGGCHASTIKKGGVIPCDRTGKHRRVRLSDVVAYQQVRTATRKAAMDSMTDMMVEAGVYDHFYDPKEND